MNKNTPTDNGTPPIFSDDVPEPGYVSRSASRTSQTDDPRAARSANRARRAQARARRDVRLEQGFARADSSPGHPGSREPAPRGHHGSLASKIIWILASIAFIAAGVYLLMPGATVLPDDGSSDITINQPIAIAAKPLTKLTKVDVYVNGRLTATHPNPSNPFSVAPPPLEGSEKVRIVAKLSSAVGLTKNQEATYIVSAKPELLRATFNGKVYKPVSDPKGTPSAPVRFEGVPSSFKLTAHFDVPVRSARAKGNLDDSFDMPLTIGSNGTSASTPKSLDFPAGDVSLVEITAVSAKGSVFHRRLAITPLPELSFKGQIDRLGNKGDYNLVLTTAAPLSDLGQVADNIRAVVRPFGSSATESGTPIKFSVQSNSITFQIRSLQLSQIIDIQILEAAMTNGGKLTAPYSLKAYTKSPGDDAEVRFIKGIYVQPDDSGPEGCASNTVNYVGTVWPSNACTGGSTQ